MPAERGAVSPRDGCRSIAARTIFAYAGAPLLMLVMYPGLAEQQDFPLTPGARLTIGRTKDNAVLCLHKSLSRTHAEVVYDGSVVQLTDLQSKNGVFVNGRRIARGQTQDQKNNDGDDQQHWNSRQQALGKKAQHRNSDLPGKRAVTHQSFFTFQ